jgi:hypothetical protein
MMDKSLNRLNLIYKEGCSLERDQDLNIAHRLMRSMGWGSCETPKPANEEIGVNPTLNAGNFAL